MRGHGRVTGQEQRVLYDIEQNRFFPDFKTVLILVVRRIIYPLKPESVDKKGIRRLQFYNVSNKRVHFQSIS